MPQNWHNLKKSTDGEKTEKDKCSLFFCCWTLCICSLFYPDTGTATFKISVNAGLCLNQHTKEKDMSLETITTWEAFGKSSRDKAWEEATEKQWSDCRSIVKIYFRHVDFGVCTPHVLGSWATTGCFILTGKPLKICTIRFFLMHLASFINFLKFLRNPDCPVLPLWIKKPSEHFQVFIQVFDLELESSIYCNSA